MEQTGQTIEDLEDLFENAPCGYLSAGSDGRITKANLTLARWLGWEREALVGRRIQDFLNIAGQIYYETHFAPLLLMQGFFNEVALDLVCADGTGFPALVNAVVRRSDGNDVRFIRITIFNASDRRRYEQELVEARRAAEKANNELIELNRTLEARIARAVEARLKSEDALRQAQKMEAVGQLTGGLAHDFNNMLAVVISALHLLERRLERGDRDVEKLVAAAKDGANRAAVLTQRLLAFSRQQTLSPKALNANKMVSEISELLRHTLGRAARLETVLAGGLWQVQADQSQLENAIVNLSINARDAMPEGGHLTIETANCHLDEAYAAEHGIKHGQYVMIAVTDTGTGMAPEIMDRVFEPFFTTKGVGKGTGLGLSQVFGFVKQSNGHIKIYSELGHGTTIRIYLPRLYGEAGSPKSAPSQKLARGSGGECILVVDDDDQILALTAQILRDLGYAVLEASSGPAALELLDAHPGTRLLLTDIVMPGVDGRQLAEEASKRLSGLKILYTTGYTRNAVVHNGVLDPGVNLLQKPASLEQLASKVRSVLDS